MASVELSTSKTIFILTVVMGCFAVLWPKVFYPMFQSSVMGPPLKTPNTEGCCDVVFEKDVNINKIMIEMCEKILQNSNDYDSKWYLAFQQGKLNKHIVEKCRREVFDRCNVDISTLLLENDKIGRTHKHILDEIRSFNSTICLKTNFGVTPGLLGTPRRMRTFKINQSKYQRQERLPHLRPDLLHPALREKGRAILQSHVVPRVEPENAPPPISRPGPIVPGMRPPMGAAGHIVPPPKGSGTVGILMPMYTIAIIVFFMYTMMKILFKKSECSEYKELPTDPDFRRTVFNDSTKPASKLNGNSHGSTKLVISAISGLVQEVNREIKSEEKGQLDKNIETKESPAEDITKSEAVEVDAPKTEQVDEENNPSAVKVVNIELTESCEGGQRWNSGITPRTRSPTPISSPSPVPPEPVEIFLEGSVPAESKVLAAEMEKDESGSGNAEDSESESDAEKGEDHEYDNEDEDEESDDEDSEKRNPVFSPNNLDWKNEVKGESEVAASKSFIQNEIVETDDKTKNIQNSKDDTMTPEDEEESEEEESEDEENEEKEDMENKTSTPEAGIKSSASQVEKYEEKRDESEESDETEESEESEEEEEVQTAVNGPLAPRAGLESQMIENEERKDESEDDVSDSEDEEEALGSKTSSFITGINGLAPQTTKVEEVKDESEEDESEEDEEETDEEMEEKLSKSLPPENSNKVSQLVKHAETGPVENESAEESDDEEEESEEDDESEEDVESTKKNDTNNILRNSKTSH